MSRPSRDISARLDDKGRLKLPTGFAHISPFYPEKKFVRDISGSRTAQVYPIKEWRENESAGDLYGRSQIGRRVPLTPTIWVGDRLDTQGRVLFSPELRRELGIENQPVKIYCYKGRIEVLTERFTRSACARRWRSPARRCGKVGGGGAEVTNYALPCDGRRGVVAAGDPSDGIYLDCTAGMGGHTGLIAQTVDHRAGDANDRDGESLELARANTAQLGGPDPLLPGHVQRTGCDDRGRGIQKVGRGSWRIWA